MGKQEDSWTSWKARWKDTEENAIGIVKDVFRLGGTRPVLKKDIPVCSSFEDALDFAIELGWLKDCLNETYKATACGLMMLSHRFKD